MQPKLRLLSAVSLFALVALAGCSLNEDPFEQPNTWHQAAVNDYNLRLMVADPADLMHGRAAEGSRGQTSANAITRLRNDDLKPLPTANQIAVIGGSQNAPAAQ